MIDVDGAELSVLLGARSLLVEVRPMVFLTVHGTQIRDGCCWLLESLGYQVYPVRPVGPEVEAFHLMATP